jgi:excisionase family DNA binding protein
MQSGVDTSKFPELLRAEEAAAYLGCAPSTLYEKAAAGKIPFVRLWEGRRKAAIRFTLESLRDHIAKNTIPAGR